MKEAKQTINKKHKYTLNTDINQNELKICKSIS